MNPEPVHVLLAGNKVVGVALTEDEVYVMRCRLEDADVTNLRIEHWVMHREEPPAS